MRKKIVILVFCGLFVVFVLSLVYYLYESYRYAKTNAVFVQADSLVYAGFTKVTGRIVKLYKSEGEAVKAGEVLAEMESEDYVSRVLALDSAVLRIKSEAQGLKREAEKIARGIPLSADKVRYSIKRIEDEMRALDEETLALRVNLEQAKRDRARFEELYRYGVVSKQSLELVLSREEELNHHLQSLRARREALIKERASLEQDLKLVLNEENTVASLRAKISALKHQEEELLRQREELNFYRENTKLVSHISGVIAKKFRSEGDVVGPGQPVYAIVDPKTFYVLVLLEENKLPGVVRGATAKVRLDSYPGVEFEGEVEEVLPASASTFALVPRDISAGEFTKLSQRIPIRVRIKSGPLHLLKVGLGGEVKIKRVKP